jgi:PAS domain S-box-containing protein
LCSGFVPGWHTSGDGLATAASFWKDHPQAIAVAGGGLLIQTAFIVGLILHYRRQRRVAEALRLSEERYREVVESQAEMVCRFRADLTLTFVNEAYCRFFKHEREELLGRRFLFLIPEDQHGQVKSSIESIIEEKSALTHEHPVMLPDGSVGWMEWSDYPIFNEWGELLELQGIGRDVTARHRAEEALRRSEERFSGIFQASPAAICIIRQEDGVLVDVNPAWRQLFEAGQQELRETDLKELGIFAGDEGYARFREFLASGETLLGFEQRVRTLKGNTVWAGISCRVSQLNDRPCYIVMTEDITARKEAEEAKNKLADATKLAMLGEITASIAHEVNQPLGAILCNADSLGLLLERESPPVEEMRTIVAEIRRDNLRASEVIKRVRGMIDRGASQYVPHDLNQVLREAEELIRHDLERHGIRFVRELEGCLPSIQGDRVQLEQVLLNLFLNAIDSLKQRPMQERWIVMRSMAREGGEWLEVWVEDNGHGIEPGHLERIFESYFTTKDSGLGLGLALSRSIVEAHGGRLSARNTTHGGAAFQLLLPVHPVSPHS